MLHGEYRSRGDFMKLAERRVGPESCTMIRHDGSTKEFGVLTEEQTPGAPTRSAVPGTGRGKRRQGLGIVLDVRSGREKRLPVPDSFEWSGSSALPVSLSGEPCVRRHQRDHPDGQPAGRRHDHPASTSRAASRTSRAAGSSPSRTGSRRSSTSRPEVLLRVLSDRAVDLSPDGHGWPGRMT